MKGNLSSDSAEQYKKMVQDAKKENIIISLSGDDSGYRVCGQPGDHLGGGRCKNGIFSQWCAHEMEKAGIGNPAAKPEYDSSKKWWKCKSNHGWGRAIDVGSGKSWVRKNGEKYGFCWGERPDESWHFTFCGPGENRFSRCSTICNEKQNKEVPILKANLSDFKSAWENEIEKPIINSFNSVDETISRPDLIKITPFNETPMSDYHTFFEYGNIQFIGNGIENVIISIIGERSETEDVPSKFFFNVYKSDKNGLSTGDNKKFADLDNISKDVITTEAKNAKNYFMDLCREFEEYPYSKEGPKEFENQNSFDI